jgi:hypothetical protein
MSPASNKDELLAELKGHHLPATLLDAVSYKLRQLEYAEQKVQLLEESNRHLISGRGHNSLLHPFEIDSSGFRIFHTEQSPRERLGGSTG